MFCRAVASDGSMAWDYSTDLQCVLLRAFQGLRAGRPERRYGLLRENHDAVRSDTDTGVEVQSVPATRIGRVVKVITIGKRSIWTAAPLLNTTCRSPPRGKPASYCCCPRGRHGKQRRLSLAVSEDNGESKNDEGKKESNRDFHSDVSLSASRAWRNLTDGDALGTFVLELGLTGQAPPLKRSTELV